MKHRKQSVKVTVECIQCKDRKDVDPRTVKEQPFCEKCYMPMIVVRAEVRQ